MKWLKRHQLYVIAFTTGAALTPAAIHSAYIQRGYFAVGGEYFIIPLMLLITHLICEITEMIREIKKDA